MPEIIRVVSDTLQAQIRRLFPAQRGFGDDLQATNLITPVVVLENAGQVPEEGAALPVQLQEAYAPGSTGQLTLTGQGSDRTNPSAGFWKLDIELYLVPNGVAENIIELRLESTAGIIRLTDYISVQSNQTASDTFIVSRKTVYVFVPQTIANTFILAQAAGGTCAANVFYRKVANLDGTPINPSGFLPSHRFSSGTPAPEELKTPARAKARRRKKK